MFHHGVANNQAGLVGHSEEAEIQGAAVQQQRMAALAQVGQIGEDGVGGVRVAAPTAEVVLVFSRQGMQVGDPRSVLGWAVNKVEVQLALKDLNPGIAVDGTEQNGVAIIQIVYFKIARGAKHGAVRIGLRATLQLRNQLQVEHAGVALGAQIGSVLVVIKFDARPGFVFGQRVGFSAHLLQHDEASIGGHDVRVISGWEELAPKDVQGLGIRV